MVGAAGLRLIQDASPRDIHPTACASLCRNEHDIMKSDDTFDLKIHAKPSRKQQPPVVSKADLDAYIERHKDSPGSLLFTMVRPGGSYVCLFPPVLDEM